MPNGTNGVPMRSLPAQLSQGQTQRYTPDQLAHLRRIQQHAVAAAAASQSYPPPNALGAQGSQSSVQSMQTILQQAQQAALGQGQQVSVNQQAPQQKRIIPPPIDSQAPVSSPRMPPTPTTATSTQLKPAVLIQEVAAIVQYQNPNLPQERVREATQQTLASYHAQLSQNIQAQTRSPVRPNPVRTVAANTGPMIGVNGPVNPVADASTGSVGAGSPRMNNGQIPTQLPQPQQPQASQPQPQPQSAPQQQSI